MDKINLSPINLSVGLSFIYFRDCESFSSFFIYVKNPLSALKFLGWKYESYIIHLEFSLNVSYCMETRSDKNILV